jgi:hypothetical protein
MKMETSDEVMDALKIRYNNYGFVLLKNVANGVGNKSRYADAIVMSLFASRGLNIYGFEIKVSRQDWLHELKHPDKADVIHNMCDGWYIVTGDPSIVLEGELPEGWGLLTAKNKKTLIEIVKPTLKERQPTIDRHFLASILVRVCQQATPEAIMKDVHKDAYELGVKKGKELYEERLQDTYKVRDELRQKINDFEKASGIPIDNYWNPSQKIGTIVRAILDGKYKDELDNLASLKRQADSISESIDKILKENDKVGVKGK